MIKASEFFKEKKFPGILPPTNYVVMGKDGKYSNPIHELALQVADRIGITVRKEGDRIGVEFPRDNSTKLSVAVSDELNAYTLIVLIQKAFYQGQHFPDLPCPTQGGRR